MNIIGLLILLSASLVSANSGRTQGKTHTGDKYRVGAIRDFSQKGEYSFEACRPFNEKENTLSFICNVNGLKTVLPISEEDLNSYKGLTQYTKERELLSEVKSKALKGVRDKLKYYKALKGCIQENAPQKLGVYNCSNIQLQVLQDVSEYLPQFRIASALKGQKGFQPDISYSSNRDERKLRSSLNMIKKNYPNATKDEKVLILESAEKFTLSPVHPTKETFGSLPPLTLNEIKSANGIYQKLPNESGTSVDEREQAFLQSKLNSSEFSRCIKREGERYRFASFFRDKEKEDAKYCGNYYSKSCEATGSIGFVSPSKCQSISRNSPFYQFIKQTDPDKLETAWRRPKKDLKKFEEKYNNILSSFPFFSFLQLDSEDLIQEQDLEGESVFKEKKSKIFSETSLALDKTIKEIENIEKKIREKDSLKSFMGMNYVIEDLLKNKVPLTKADCDILEKNKRNYETTQSVIDWGLIGVSIVGGIACPFTLGVGCAVTIASEGALIARDYQKRKLQEGLFLSGNGDLKDYIDSRNSLQTNIALAPLALIGLPIVSSVAKTTQFAQKVGARFSSRGGRSIANKPSSIVKEADSHSTAKLLEGIGRGDASEYARRQIALLDEGISTGKLYGRELSAKELESLKHQKDIIEGVKDNPEVLALLQKEGFDLDAYIRGTVDSDLGKLEAYRELLFKPSAKSDMLLDFLRGQGPQKSAEALGEILEGMGFKKGQFIFNGKTDNDAIRKAIEDNPILTGYLHEFPGMSDAVLAFEKGILTKAQFQAQIRANLFHNGPSKGFWNFLESRLIPNVAEENSLRAVFNGGVFDVGEGAAPVYGSPSSYESFVGTFFDRLSQGTRGGFDKIREELSGQESIDLVRNLVVEDNPTGTLEQLRELRSIAENSKSLTDGQRQQFLELSEAGIIRLENYQRYTQSRIKVGKPPEDIRILEDTGVERIFRAQKTGTPPEVTAYEEVVEVNGREVSQRVISVDEGRDAIYQSTDSIINFDEVVNGNPVTGLTLSTSRFSPLQATGGIDTSTEFLAFKDKFDSGIKEFGLDNLRENDIDSYRLVLGAYTEFGSSSPEFTRAIRNVGGRVQSSSQVSDTFREIDDYASPIVNRRVSLANNRSLALKRTIIDEMKLPKENVKDVDCKTVRKLSAGFPSNGKNCFAFNTKDNEEVLKGKFCSCGARATNWVIKCPASPDEFLRATNYYDQLGLQRNEKAKCFRVDIPDGATCFAGPAGPRRSGLGGMSQIFCPNRIQGDVNLRDASDSVINQTLDEAEEAWRELGIPREWQLTERNHISSQLPNGRPGISFSNRVVAWSPNPESSRMIQTVEDVRNCMMNSCNAKGRDEVIQSFEKVLNENAVFKQVRRGEESVDTWAVKPDSTIDQAELDDVRRYVCQFMCPTSLNMCKGPDAKPIGLHRNYYDGFGSCNR